VPVRIVVHLLPSGPRSPVPPPHTGPAVYAAVLAAVRASDPTLATAIHERPRYKPLALSPLLDADDRPATAGSSGLRIEIGVLVDELTAAMLVAVKGVEVVRIARGAYRVADVEILNVSSYAELASVSDPAARRWTLRLLTAVAFATSKEEGALRLRVLPERVFGSLLARWQALAASVPMPEGIAEAIGSGLAIGDWRLERAEHLIKTGDAATGRKDVFWSGSTGSVTYQLADPGGVAPRVRAGLDALARFATYAGIGDRTNVGMGVVRDGQLRDLLKTGDRA